MHQMSLRFGGAGKKERDSQRGVPLCCHDERFKELVNRLPQESRDFVQSIIFFII